MTSQRAASRQHSVQRTPQPRGGGANTPQPKAAAAGKAAAAAPAVKFVESLGERADTEAAHMQPALTHVQPPTQPAADIAQLSAASEQTADVAQAPDAMPAPQVSPAGVYMHVHGNLLGPSEKASRLRRHPLASLQPHPTAGAHFTICRCVGDAARGQLSSRRLPCKQPPRHHRPPIADAG